jgi:hypothetical protein
MGIAPNARRRARADLTFSGSSRAGLPDSWRLALPRGGHYSVAADNYLL